MLFGMAYTWAKALNLTDTDTRNKPMFQSASQVYGKAGYDQTHVLTFNVVWDVAKRSQLILAGARKISGAVLDNSQVSRFATLASGTPLGISYTTTDKADFTSSAGDGVRVLAITTAQLPVGDRAFDHWFDTNAFARLLKGNAGNTPKDVFRRPATNNWDLSLFKNFPLWSEKRVVQFRGEFYSAFNHTQFSSLTIAARFGTTGMQTNAQVGQGPATLSARIIQLPLTLRF